MMNIPQNVALLKEENDLKLYHYTDQAQHPSDADFWKGVVMDGNTVVARSFPWAPTVVTDDLPDDQVYTPLYEATILRFYRHEGKPMIGTHRQIDISNRDSRVTPASRRFIDLVREAIAAWEYREYTYTTPSPHTNDTINGYAFTPSSWEELCVAGWCHVFLLVDTSNQITDLVDLSETREMFGENGESDIVTFTGPKLIHALSFTEGGDMNEYGVYPMVPYGGQVSFDVSPDELGYQQYTWLVPQLTTMTREQAEEHIADAGAVVGFSPLSPDVTVKYLSPEYARKLELAGETFNPIHRWHQLMDESVEDANEYVSNLPWHLKHISLNDMSDAHAAHINKIVTTLSDNLVARFNRQDATMDRRLYTKVGPIVTDVVSTLRTKYGRNTPRVNELRNEAESLLLERLLALKYSERHAIHGTIQRIAHEQNTTRQVV